MPLTGEQIRLRGLAALRRELGRAGLVRFLQHFKPGAGNYTRERQKFLAGLTMDELRCCGSQPQKEISIASLSDRQRACRGGLDAGFTPAYYPRASDSNPWLKLLRKSTKSRQKGRRGFCFERRGSLR